MKETTMVNPLDKILPINQRDRDANAADFEVRHDTTKFRFGQEVERFVLLARDEFESYGVNPGLDVYELDHTLYAGIGLPHSLKHHFLVLFTDEGYRLVESGEQCYIDEQDRSGQTVKILRNPVIDNRTPFYQEGDPAGDPSHGHLVDAAYQSTPLALPEHNKWHDSSVFSEKLEPIQERELSMMAEDLRRLSDKIENTKLLRSAGL